MQAGLVNIEFRISPFPLGDVKRIFISVASPFKFELVRRKDFFYIRCKSLESFSTYIG